MLHASRSAQGAGSSSTRRSVCTSVRRISCRELHGAAAMNVPEGSLEREGDVLAVGLAATACRLRRRHGPSSGTSGRPIAVGIRPEALDEPAGVAATEGRLRDASAVEAFGPHQLARSDRRYSFSSTTLEGLVDMDQPRTRGDQSTRPARATVVARLESSASVRRTSSARLTSATSLSISQRRGNRVKLKLVDNSTFVVSATSAVMSTGYSRRPDSCRGYALSVALGADDRPRDAGSPSSRAPHVGVFELSGSGPRCAASCSVGRVSKTATSQRSDARWRRSSSRACIRLRRHLRSSAPDLGALGHRRWPSRPEMAGRAHRRVR
jgi:hypothetical protein